jgi:hypothetical protein
MAHDVGTGTPAGGAVMTGRSWVSWGAVFSGALIGAAVMTLLSLLWYAIAVGGPNFVSDNITWFLGGTAIVATFLAGLFAGWFASGRGPEIGVVQGLTEWGLLTFAVVVVGPGLATILRSLLVTRATVTGQTWLWASFWSVLIGLAVALIGGALGGWIASPRAGTTIRAGEARTGNGNGGPVPTREPTREAASPEPTPGADPHRTDVGSDVPSGPYRTPPRRR